MGAGGTIIILKAIKQTLGASYTSSAPVRVWHTLVASAVLGFVLGKIF
jgi:hypothetical protein